MEKLIRMSELCESKTCTENKKYEKLFEKKEFSYNDTIQGYNYYRAIIIKSTIINALTNWCWDNTSPSFELDLKRDTLKYMLSRYAEVGFMNSQQLKSQVLYDNFLVCRYLKSEYKKATIAEPMKIEVGKYTVWVAPDVIFECGDSAELVWYKIGKVPAKNSKNDKRSADFNIQLQLYAGVLYARKKGFKNITSSYYYLRRSDDVLSDMDRCSPSFWGTGGNVIQLHDMYDKDANTNALDEQFNDYIKLLNEGVSKDMLESEVCNICEYRDLCKYSLPPQKD